MGRAAFGVLSSRQPTVTGALKPVGYEQITAITTTAKALTYASYPTANLALIQAENADLRWRDDGTNPTATVGMYLPALTTCWYNGDLTKLKVIAASGTGILNVTYYSY